MDGGNGSVTTAALRPRSLKQPCPSQVTSKSLSLLLTSARERSRPAGRALFSECDAPRDTTPTEPWSAANHRQLHDARSPRYLRDRTDAPRWRDPVRSK